MHLQTLWFILIAVLWTGYFVLEGFDFGVGMLLPFLGRDDAERRTIINTIGPVWDGNEVWLLTAGGATFAAFPGWYATLFSAAYLPLFLVLLALIARGVAFEYRSKHDNPKWRATWDRAIFVGSVVPAVIWGAAFSSILAGIPIDGDGNFTGSLFSFLHPYALLGGVLWTMIFLFNGAVFLSLRTTGELEERARTVSRRIAWPTTFVLFAWLGWTLVNAVNADDKGVVPSPVPITAVLAMVAAAWLVRENRFGWAFTAVATSVGLIVSTVFANLYPHVLISSIDRGFSPTIWNTSSTHYTLVLMTVVAGIMVPIVLAYQAWTYWVFRHRLGVGDLPSFARPAAGSSSAGADEPGGPDRVPADAGS